MIKTNVVIRTRVETTEMDAVTRSMIMSVSTCSFVKGFGAMMMAERQFQLGFWKIEEK